MRQQNIANSDVVKKGFGRPEESLIGVLLFEYMVRLVLNKQCKNILLSINDNKYKSSNDDTNTLLYLQHLGLIEGTSNLNGNFIHVSITEYGKAYIAWNPKLKNPSIFQDTKYVINTVLSIIAIIISIIAIFA